MINPEDPYEFEYIDTKSELEQLTKTFEKMPVLMLVLSLFVIALISIGIGVICGKI